MRSPHDGIYYTTTAGKDSHTHLFDDSPFRRAHANFVAAGPLTPSQTGYSLATPCKRPPNEYYVSSRAVPRGTDVYASLTAAGLPSRGNGNAYRMPQWFFARTRTPIVRQMSSHGASGGRRPIAFISQGEAIPSLDQQPKRLVALPDGPGFLMGSASVRLRITLFPRGWFPNTAGTAKYLVNAQGTFILSDAPKPMAEQFHSCSLTIIISSLPSQGGPRRHLHPRKETAAYQSSPLRERRRAIRCQVGPTAPSPASNMGVGPGHRVMTQR
jgi:hypothetical protein